MFAMKIQMDEEKILREGKINLQKVYAALDRIFAKYNLVKGETEPDGTLNYLGTESNKDFGRFTTVAINLEDVNTWFAPNCKKWLWGDNEEIPGVWNWEDMLEAMRKRGEL